MPGTAATSAFASGLLFGLSLIVALGPQNVFVIRQGAAREHVVIVVAICAASDALLIAAGVGGAGAVIGGRHWLVQSVRIGGCAVLLAYAALTARRALVPDSVGPGEAGKRSSRGTAIAACLLFTWLNPWVYLDTVVLLGSVANSQRGHQWWFGGGAALGSVLWFVAIAGVARLAHPLLARPGVWRGLDSFVAVVMAITAVRIL